MKSLLLITLIDDEFVLSIVSEDPSKPASAALWPRLRLDLSSIILLISGLEIDVDVLLDDFSSFCETSSK